MKLKVKKAFSLIELSIVLILIGIIIAGITQSTRIIAAYKLQIARSATNSSPVSSMKSLVLWLETVSEKSFDDNETEESSAVSTWYEINPTSNGNQILTQTGSERPTYVSKCINFLPCLRFDGTDDTFPFNGNILVGTDYTIFVLEQRRSSGSRMFMGGSSLTLNTNLQLGYRNDTTYIFDQLSNDTSSSVAAYTKPIPRIHSYVKSSSDGKFHYVNGILETSTDSGSGNPTDHLVSFANAAIGSYFAGGEFFNGDIAEIIIFNSVLKTKDRLDVEKYLGKKWSVSVD